MEASVQLHDPAALLYKKSSSYPLDRRLVGPRAGLDAVVKSLYKFSVKVVSF